MATDPQTLLNAAACYDCGAMAGQWGLYRLGLLKIIANTLNPSMATDAQSLVNQAACYQCVTPGMQFLIELGLLAQIANNAGGLVGTGSPIGVVNGAAGQTYYDTAGQHFYVNASGTPAGWHLLV